MKEMQNQNHLLHSGQGQHPGQRGICTCLPGRDCDFIWAGGCRVLILESSVLGRLQFFIEFYLDCYF